MVAPAFGRDHIEWEILEQWRMRNPQAFMEIITETGDLAGCFVILGLEDSFMEQFINGTISEGQITGEDVLTMTQTKKLSRIYISGLMVPQKPSASKNRRVYVMVWCMIRYLRHFFGTKVSRTLFAVALNKESEKLLDKLKFSVHTSALNRKDRHKLYSIEFLNDTVEEVSREMGDFSKMCQMSYRIVK